MRIPKDKIWRQLNTGNQFGVLAGSFNINLTENFGTVRGTRLIHDNSTSADLANLGLPVGFVKFNDGGGLANAPYFTVAGARVFYSSAGSMPTTFIQDATSGTPTTCASDVSDLQTFNTALYVTTASNSVYKKASGGSWSNFTAGSADSNNHKLCVYANRMYMQTAQSKVISWNTSDTVVTSGTNTLQLSSASFGGSDENVITFMLPVSDGIWIGTVNTLGGNGRVYFWDGVTADTPRSSYVLESTGAMAGVVKDNVLYIMDNDGRLLGFNGGAFIELARLPIYSKKTLNGALNLQNERWIHPNGMTIVNHKININVSLTLMSNSTQNEEFAPSGIWEYDKDIGLYHKYSPSYLEKDSGAVTDYGQMFIVASTGSGVESGAGGLAWIQNNVDSASKNGTLLAGFKYYTNASSTEYGIFYDDTNSTFQTYSSLVSTWVNTDQAKESWQKIFIKYRQFLDSADKIVTKYRITEASPTYISITWINTTSFTTTTDVSALTGYEVEILQGTGSGKCAHITSVSGSGTYTVNLDETFTGVTTGTANARVQAWIKVSSITGQIDEYSIATMDSIASPRIQIKVCMQFTGKDELHEMGLINNTDEPLA